MPVVSEVCRTSVIFELSLTMEVFSVQYLLHFGASWMMFILDNVSTTFELIYPVFHCVSKKYTTQPPIVSESIISCNVHCKSDILETVHDRDVITPPLTGSDTRLI